MGFFDSRGNTAKPEAKTVQSERVVARPTTASSSPVKGTLVGPHMVFEGVTRGREDLTVEGTIKGQLNCEKHVLVGQSGVVEAKVICHSITIRGQVIGNVEAADRITIEETGRLTGDITAKVFINQPGGFFEGYSHMLKGAPEPKKNKEPEPSKKDKKGN